MASAENNGTSDNFQSFVNEFAEEAKFFGRASLPNEFTGTVAADLRSSVSMETTTTATTRFDYSPCGSGRNSNDLFILRTPKSVHEFTYTVSSRASPLTPSPAGLKLSTKPPRILYGPCPDRHFHTNEVCPTCHLTDQQYRIERLEQSRHVYGKLSREYATKKSLIQRSNSINKKEVPCDPPPTPAEKGISTTATSMANGRKDKKSMTTSAYPPPTIARHLTSALQHQQQQQRRSSLAVQSSRVSMGAAQNTGANSAAAGRRTSLTPSMPSRFLAPTMSSSRKSVVASSPAAGDSSTSRKSLLATNTATPSSRKASLTPVLPSTSRLLAPTLSFSRKSIGQSSLL